MVEHCRKENTLSAPLSAVRAERLRVKVLRRRELEYCSLWRTAFASHRKDRRFYELVEDTIHQDFDYRYFAIIDENGQARAVQPFLMLDQDLLAGLPTRLVAWVSLARRVWPRFMRLRTLMVGCAAGEGHLDGADEATRCVNARALAATILEHARSLETPLVVLKEFPASYRAALQCFVEKGFARMPSMPMACLNIDYLNFDDYVRRKLSKIDEIYLLYLQVYERSTLRFEKLTKEFLCELGRRIPDKVRFFLWRQGGRIIAFSVCMVQRDALYAEYLGLDYAVALQLHLYFVVMRDLISWAMANGYKSLHSSGLNYDPKYRLRYVLNPLDLYARRGAKQRRTM